MEDLATSSPAFKKRLYDTISPPPVSSAAPPDSLQRNHIIMATVLPLPAAQIATINPDLAASRTWYEGIKLLIGKLQPYTPSVFIAWSHPELPVDHAAHAKAFLENSLNYAHGLSH